MGKKRENNKSTTQNPPFVIQAVENIMRRINAFAEDICNCQVRLSKYQVMVHI